MSTTKRNLNHALIAQFSGQTNYITIPKLYCRLTGCLNKANLLNQIIHYSALSTYCKDNWFYKSYEEWLEELMISERTLRTYFKEFVNSGFIEMRIAKVKGKRTPFFRPLMENITKAIEQIILSDLPPEPEPVPPPPPPQEHPKPPVVKTCPKRQLLPDSQTAKIAVSNTIYTDKKDQIKNTTKKSSSSDVSEKTDLKFLKHKLPSDTRSDSAFLQHCYHHMEHNNDKTKYSLYQRVKGLCGILKLDNEAGEYFCSKGFIDSETKRLKEEKNQREEASRMKAQDAIYAKKMAEYAESQKKNG